MWPRTENPLLAEGIVDVGGLEGLEGLNSIAGWVVSLVGVSLNMRLGYLAILQVVEVVVQLPFPVLYC